MLAGLDKALFNVAIPAQNGCDAKIASGNNNGIQIGDSNGEISSFSGELDKKISDKLQAMKAVSGKETVVSEEVIAQLQSLQPQAIEIEALVVPEAAVNVDKQTGDASQAFQSTPIVSTSKEQPITENEASALEVEGFKESVDAVKASKESLAQFNKPGNSEQPVKNDNVLAQKMIAVESGTEIKESALPNKSLEILLDKVELTTIEASKLAGAENVKPVITQVSSEKSLVGNEASIKQAKELQVKQTISTATKIQTDTPLASSVHLAAVETIGSESLLKNKITPRKIEVLGVTDSNEAGFAVSIQTQAAQANQGVSSAEAAKFDALEGAAVVRQIVDDIRVSFDSNTRSMTIALDPPELGKVNIRLSQSGGELSGVLEVERADVHRQIQRELPQVISALQNSGIEVKKVEVVLTSQNDSESFSSGAEADAGGMASDSNESGSREDGLVSESVLADELSLESQREIIADDAINVYM